MEEMKDKNWQREEEILKERGKEMKDEKQRKKWRKTQIITIETSMSLQFHAWNFPRTSSMSNEWILHFMLRTCCKTQSTVTLLVDSMSVTTPVPIVS